MQQDFVDAAQFRGGELRAVGRGDAVFDLRRAAGADERAGDGFLAQRPGEARETGRTEPKYRQIASDLRARIEAGEFPDGRLPGKESLKAHYRVAVNTLDRVLQVLRSEGRIETVQGA